MRQYWVRGESYTLVSGVHNDGVCALLNKVESPYESIIVESAIELGIDGNQLVITLFSSW